MSRKKKKLANQNRFNIAAVFVLALVLILALVLYKANTNKKKINDLLQSQKEEIELKNKELEVQKTEVQRQKENIEFAYNDIKMLSEIGKDITSSIRVEEIIETVYENVSSLMKSTVFGIGIYNKAKKRLDFSGAYENGRKLPFFYNELSEDNRLAVWCFRQQKEIIIHEYMVDSKNYFPDIPEPKAGENTESLLYVPLTLKDNKIGVITVQSFRKHIYSDYHLEILRNIANYAAIALENADAYTRIERQNKRIEDYNIELEKQKEEIQHQAENLREANEIITGKNRSLTELNADKDKYLNRINFELSQAAKYVQSIIPSPLDNSDLKVDWRFIPSAQLGGDAFGYHYIDDDNIALYLLDVCGHGIGPALHSISVFNTIKYQVLPGTDFHKPVEVLHSLNKMFQMTEHHDLYFTLWYGVYNINESVLEYAGAGHPPAVLCNASPKPKLLEPSNAFIGGFPQFDFSSKKIELHGLNQLYIFSDGAYEVRKLDNGFWTIEELSEYLFKRCNADDGGEMDELYEYLKNLKGSDRLKDDFSIMKVTIGTEF